MSDKLKGVWIDGGVWECEQLTLLEKHFLQKIKDLDNNEGCFAMNTFFSEFFGVSKGRCTQIIGKLEEKGMIEKTLQRKGHLVTKRVLKITKKAVKFFKQGVKEIKLGVKEIKQPIKEIKLTSLENDVYNNIVLNNRVNNLVKNIKEKNTHIQELESENEKLKKQIAFLKNQNKEDSSAIIPPPTEEQIKKEKKFEGYLKNYHFNGWTEKLKENYFAYWEVRDEKLENKYGERLVIDNVYLVEAMRSNYNADICEEAVEMAKEGNGWAKFYPDRIVNQRERDRIKTNNTNNSQNDDGTPAYMMGLQ